LLLNREQHDILVSLVVILLLVESPGAASRPALSMRTNATKISVNEVCVSTGYGDHASQSLRRAGRSPAV